MAEYFQRAKRGNGYSFAVAHYSKQGKDGKVVERKRDAEHDNLLQIKDNPFHGTICYKIVETVFEAETSYGSSPSCSTTR